MNVSIIIPIYNVEQYITECLQSVMNQTMTDGVECILVDDCGQDKSMQIAESMVVDYDGPIEFHIIHHKKNKGLSCARNTGIKVAKGEYLYFLDSDDTITEDCINSMLTLVEKYPDVNCVFAGAITSNGSNYMDYTKKDFPEYSKDRDWIQEGMLKRYLFSMTAWNRLISSKFVINNNLYFEEGFIHEDELWNLAISQVITSACFINKNLYIYNVREGSIIKNAKVDNRLYLDRHILLCGKMVQNAKGYRVDLQIDSIMSIIVEAMEKFLNVKDYIKWVQMNMECIHKAPSLKKINLFKTFLNNNIYIFKYYLSKFILKRL